MKNLKKVYQAISKKQAEIELDRLEEKGEEKYPLVINSWKNNWEELSAYFEYLEPVRRIIYITNTTKGFSRLNKLGIDFFLER